MLRVSVIGVLLAATLLAPEVAYAYGRAAPTPDIFADWREIADSAANCVAAQPVARRAMRAVIMVTGHAAARFAHRFSGYSDHRLRAALRGWLIPATVAVGAAALRRSAYRSGVAGRSG